MAGVYGKSYLSWAQCSNPCILDPTSISAISKWQLALSRTKTNPETNTNPNPQTSAPPRPGSPESPVLAFWGGHLRGESQIGGRP
jgi:hypothetical protein